MSEFERPDSKEFVVIGFWNKKNICYGQYFVNRPVIYNLKGTRNLKSEVKTKGEFMDNSQFLFEGELGELFFFHR